MNKKYISKIDETLYVKNYNNGLTAVFIKKENFNKIHASVTTKFGSLNNNFLLNNDEYEITDGIAHFLEHKMFENPKKDVFELFSQYGASVNAYTSFDHTCYYFSCSNNFKDNFAILLEMITTPYFTDKTVNKEKGIIAEEIKMYEDDPYWILYYELLKNLYESHPLRIDIAGSINSINSITKDDLYLCYNSFYHPRNLIVTVVGNFDLEEANNLIIKYYGDINDQDEVYNISTEDIDVFKKSSEVKMDIKVTKYAVGYKQRKTLYYDPIRESAINIYLKLLFGQTSSNYEKLSSKGIFTSFQYSEIDTTGFAMISSEVKDERQFLNLIEETLDSKVSEESFNKYKKKLIGSNIRIFNSIDNLSRLINDCYVNNYEIEDMLEGIEMLTYSDMINYAKELFDEKNRTCAIVKPKSK
ncbi:MAG: EF-P 5-aminopentanol modification-associated protein YfmH [Bacilli bacterium]